MSHFTFARCTGGGSAPSAQVCTICIICPFSSWLPSAPPTFPPPLPSTSCSLAFQSADVTFPPRRCSSHTQAAMKDFKSVNSKWVRKRCSKRSLKWTLHDWRRRGDMKDVNQSIGASASLGPRQDLTPFFLTAVSVYLSRFPPPSRYR